MLNDPARYPEIVEAMQKAQDANLLHGDFFLEVVEGNLSFITASIQAFDATMPQGVKSIPAWQVFLRESKFQYLGEQFCCNDVGDVWMFTVARFKGGDEYVLGIFAMTSTRRLCQIEVLGFMVQHSVVVRDMSGDVYLPSARRIAEDKEKVAEAARKAKDAEAAADPRKAAEVAAEERKVAQVAAIAAEEQRVALEAAEARRVAEAAAAAGAEQAAAAAQRVAMEAAEARTAAAAAAEQAAAKTALQQAVEHPTFDVVEAALQQAEIAGLAQLELKVAERALKTCKVAEALVQAVNAAELEEYAQEATSWCHAQRVTSFDDVESSLAVLAEALKLTRVEEIRLGKAFASRKAAAAADVAAADAIPAAVPFSNSKEHPLQVVQLASLATSEFKRLYEVQGVVTFQHDLFGALQGILRGYAELTGDTEANADQLFEALQSQVFDSPMWQSLLSCNHREVAKVAVVTWTSATKLGLPSEFCTILNQVIRMDSGDALRHAVVFTRAMTSHLVNRDRSHQDSSREWPDDFVSYRGSNIPRAELDFFVKDQLYRAPMFLATSFSEAKAREFLHRTPKDGQVPVLFKFFIDRVQKCDHAMYIEGMTLQQGEQELLFAPYSAFTVLTVHIPEGSISCDQPIVIEIKVHPNNKAEHVPEDVPLAQWH